MRFFDSSGGASPESVAIADIVPCWSRGLVVPRIEVRTPRRIPLTCSRDASPRSLPPRTFRGPSIRDRPDNTVSSSAVLAVSKGRCPSRPCSAGESVPSNTVFGRSLAYPPWALFPFEVTFMSFLSVRPSFDDALHHRHSATAYRCSCVRPSHCFTTTSRGSVRRAPCHVRVHWQRRPKTSSRKVGRVPVARIDVSIGTDFGFAGDRPVTSSQTFRRPALLVWCSFGHHRWRMFSASARNASISRGCHHNHFLAVLIG